MQRKHTIEILAPAKNLEVGRIAIDAGADAVYIGGPSFGARKAAGNSIDDIAELCRYAHLFRAKVLVTLNTLLRDNEMSEAVRLAHAYKEIGVDAIIIQDLRLARILFDSGNFPRVSNAMSASPEPHANNEHVCYLHASTQCDNRTLERVQELEQMGFKRVVLARELSFDEIRHIREHTSCELEAFVHGALCVSYSGACYLSEAVCGRSANRGECAQMCRLAYDVLDEDQNELLHQKHILSLKDLDRSTHLRELIATGVTTLKIEGRLKDADYVRNVVTYYRQLIDRLIEQDSSLAHASEGVCRRSFVPNPEKTFHRGATDYFSFGRPDNLVNQNTPKSTGEFIGIAPLSAAAIQSLHNGDGLTFAGEGFYWPNNRVHIPVGTPVYRNLDTDFQKQLAAKDATTRVLPVAIRFAETTDGFALTFSAGDTTVTQTFPAQKTPAQNAERAESVVRQQLAKLGGTHLETESIHIEWTQPFFLPAAVLNEWRRQAADAFFQKRTALTLNGNTEKSQSVDRLLTSSNTTTNDSSNIPTALMTCKYCILNELGCCKTKNPRKTGIPTYLRQNGLLLRIRTDCRACVMTIEKI